MTARSTPTLTVLALVAVALAVGSCAPEPTPEEPAVLDPGEWPQWRGPEGLGVSESKKLPREWGPDSPNIRWRTVLPGLGNSSPIVSRGKVFVTSALRRKGKTNVRRFLLGLDFKSGELLWTTELPVGEKAWLHSMNTDASTTPVTDGETVFANFGDVLAAVDHDGEIVWTRETDEEYVESSFHGAGSSPVLAGDSVIVLQDREKLTGRPGWLGAFSKASGEELWRVEWTDTCCSYVTPLVRKRGDALEIIVTHARFVAGYDAATGDRLWSHEIELNQPVASAVTWQDLLIVFSGAHGVRQGAALRLTGSGPDTRVELLWSTGRMIPGVSSPVVYRDLLFTVNEKGIAVCYRLEDGQVLWRERLPGSYNASLVAGANRIYAQSDTSGVAVFAARDRFEPIAQNDLGEGSNASPALARGSIVLRTQEALLRIDRKTPAQRRAEREGNEVAKPAPGSPDE